VRRGEIASEEAYMHSFNPQALQRLLWSKLQILSTKS
jgi:hypothetical protein